MSDIPPPDQPEPTGQQYVQYPRAQGPQAYPYEVGPPQFDLSVIGMAWKLVQSNLGNWIVAEILLGILGVGMNMVVMFSLQAAHLTPPPGVFPTWQQYVTQELFMFPVIVLQYAMQVGYYRMALNQLRGLPTSPMDVFAFKGQFLPVLLGTFLFMFITWLGIAFLILPGLILSTLLAFTNLLILDRGMKVDEAMKLSWTVVKPHMWTAMGVFIVAALASFLGAFACCIGLLITVPIFVMSVAILYERFFRQEVVVAPVAQIPPFSV